MLLFFVDLRRPKINTRKIRAFQINMTNTYIHTDNTVHILSLFIFYLQNISYAFTGGKKSYRVTLARTFTNTDPQDKVLHYDKFDFRVETSSVSDSIQLVLQKG